MAALALALAGAFAAGWRIGAGRVQGAWDAAELQRERAVQTLGAQERRRQAAESDKFEALRAALRTRATHVLPELRNELQGPIACVGGASAPARLADLPVPAGAVGRLRRAGADPRTD